MGKSRALRHDGRLADALRPVKIKRRYTRSAPGSVLIQAGRTTVLCTASVDEEVPPWMHAEEEPRGWITAEYGMLPGSTQPRKRRDRGGRIDGRSTEIQRLIGRSLRAVADLRALGPRTVTIDCDVLEADGGTRTISITGALVALVDALNSVANWRKLGVYPLKTSIAAVSVGIVDGRPVTDLDYIEDAAATVDMNVVMTGTGQFVEIQGTGEEATFSGEELEALLRHAQRGIRELTQLQRKALGRAWPFD